jgi:hypothetical protein
VIFRKTPSQAPAVDKTPFVRWRPSYLYVSSMHTLAPRRLNLRFPDRRPETTGCLAHFKFVSLLREKAAEEIERREHYADSAEYKAYHASLANGGLRLSYDGSWRFEGWESFARAGLMMRGDWF